MAMKTIDGGKLDIYYPLHLTSVASLTDLQLQIIEQIA